MPTLYPENTNYSGASSVIKYPKITNAMLQSMKQKAQTALSQQYARLAALQTGATKPAATPTTPALPYGVPDTSNLSAEEQSANITSYVNSGKTLAPATAFKPGMTVKEYEEEANIPFVYEDPVKGYQVQGGYLKPSEVSPLAKIVNFEGGQYISDPAHPGKAVVTARPAANYKARELLLQGLNPNLYQIDHKIPLWAGGMDTAGNKEILTNSEHATKTKIQAVPFTLLANGLIGQREAMSMALSWKDKENAWDINYPTPGEAGSETGAGLIDVEQAKKIAEKWTKTPGVTFKSWLKELPAASEKIYQAGANLMNKILPGKDSFSTGVKEFSKGFVSGVPVVGEVLPQTSKFGEGIDTTGKVSHVVGAIVGNVITFGAAYKLAVKGLAKVGVKWAAKEVGEQAAREAAEKVIADLSAKKVLTIAEDVALKEAQGMLKKTEPILRKITTEAGRKEALGALNKGKLATIGKATTIGGVSAVLGQAYAIPEDQTRLERAAYDFAYGAFMPVNAKYNVAGYARVAVPALTISLMEGTRNPTESYANAMAAALVNAGTMVGFHGLGHAGTAYKVATGKAPKGILYAGTTPGEGVEPSAFIAGGKIVAVAPSEKSAGVIGSLKKGLASLKTKEPKTGTKTAKKIEEILAPSTTDYSQAPATALEKKMKAAALRVSNQVKESLAMEGKTYLSSGAATPEDFGIKSLDDLTFPRTNNKKKLDEQTKILCNILDWRQKYYGLNQNDTKTNKLLVFAASREQYKSGLGNVARTKADVEDWISYSKKMGEPDPNNLVTAKVMKNLAANLPDEYHTPPTGASTHYDTNSKLLNGKVPFTGINIDEGKRKQFIKDIEAKEYAATPVGDGSSLIKVQIHLDPHKRTLEAVQEGAKEYGYDSNKTLVVYAPKKDGTMTQIATVSSQSRIEDPTGKRGWSYNQNALDEWNKRHKTNLKLKDLTPEQRKEIGLFDPNLNFETLADEMLKRGTSVIEMTARITPETMNSKVKGSPKSFYMGYVNDETWNVDTHNKLKALMTKEAGFKPAEAEVATANIASSVKEATIDIPENISAEDREAYRAFMSLSGKEAPKTEVAVTKVQKTPEELKAEGYKNFKDDLAKPNEYVEPVLDTAAGQVTVSAKPEKPSQILRGTKGLTVDDIIKTYKNIKLKKDVPITNINGDKTKIIKGEALTPYELKGNKVLLQDGDTYVVTKNQFQNIKGQSLVAEGKPFAPDLEGLEETVMGYKGKEMGEVISGKNVIGSRPPKHFQYQLPDGENYKEILIRTPELGKTNLQWKQNKQGLWAWFQGDEQLSGAFVQNTPTQMEIAEGTINKATLENIKGNFKSSHWDEPNVLAHIRLNERTYNGKKVTFMEELQSDWARELRSKGVAGDFETAQKTTKDYFDTLAQKYGSRGMANILDRKATPVEKARYYELNDLANKAGRGVPNHPLLKKWQELGIKRALKEAVDEDAQYFSWINGDQTSARYDLATQVEKIEWKNRPFNENGEKLIHLNTKEQGILWVPIDKNGIILEANGKTPNDWKGKKLDEVLGKGLADKITTDEKGTLSGEGLKFGGEWADNLYNKQIKNIVEDLTGGKVEIIDMKLPVEKVQQRFVYNGSQGDVMAGDLVTPKTLKIGQEIYKPESSKNSFIITDILGDGKFKAVEKRIWDNRKNKLIDLEGLKKTFDISNKTTTQQAIKLTPEIKAKIKGKAPTIKTSKKMF